MVRLRPWLAATLFLLSLPDVAHAAGEELTLEDALTLALANNPTVQNAGISVEKAGDQVEATQARRFPSLNLHVRELRNFTDESFEFKEGSLGTVSGQPVPAETRKIDTQSDFTTHVSVEAKQPIVGLYKIGLDVDRLKVYESRARQDLRARRQEIAKDVKEQYYEILETQSALQSTQESIAFYQSLAKVVGDKVKQKTALEYELLDTEAKLAKAEYDSLKQRNTMLSEKERLNELMGRDIYTPFTVTASLAADETIPDAEKARALAMEQRPDVKEVRLRLRQAEYELDLRQAEYLPNLDLLASYNRSVNTSFVPDQSFYVGLVARWEFFDWGRRSDEVSKARHSISEAHNDIRRVDTRVATEVNGRLRDLQNARQLVTVATKARTAAREKLRVTQNRYKQQAALLDDVLKAQSDLATATNDFHQAVLKVWTARANLAKALGEE
jgi:outer membrane protein